MEAGVKSDDFTDNSEIAIELTDLAAQVGEAICQHDGIAFSVGVKKPIERGLDYGGFCRPTSLGCARQSRRGAFGEIDAYSRF
jgi:hypothetical protein